MDSEELKLTLAKLHQALAAADRVDVESAEMLHQAIDDIGAALDGVEEKIEHQADKAHDNLESMAVRFDAEHPTLAGLIRQLNAALSRMGI